MRKEKRIPKPHPSLTGKIVKAKDIQIVGLIHGCFWIARKKKLPYLDQIKRSPVQIKRSTNI